MRHRRWLEVVKDYDCEILYHPEKANKVAYSLNRKSTIALMSIQALLSQLQEEIFELEIELVVGQVSALTLQPTIFDKIKGAQELDSILMRIKEEVLVGKNIAFCLSQDGISNFNGRLCVLNNEKLRKQILYEAHETPYSMYPGVTKMYKDMR